MNYIEDDDQPQTTPNLIGALGNLLSTNTDQRNMALAELNGARQLLQKAKQAKHDLAFELYGRLIKYEPDVFEEVKNYVMNNDVFYATSSDKLNIYSKIDNYTTANGKKTFKAHYTIYGHYLKKCETEDEAPISYNGRFLMKKYIDLFIFNKWATEYKKVEDFFIPLTDEPVEEETEPVEEETDPKLKPFPRSECDKCHIQVLGNNTKNGGGACKEQNYIYCGNCYITEVVAKMPGYEPVETPVDKPKRKYTRKPKV